MKQLRFILAALLLMVCGTIAHAQKVVVYKSDGTKVEYNASDVKEVKYEKAEVDYGYYGYSTESYQAAAALSASNYTKLTSSPQEITWGKTAYVVIATPTNVKPSYKLYSVMDNDYSEDFNLFNGARGGASDTITINGKQYYVWFANAKTLDTDTSKIKITIN